MENMEGSLLEDRPVSGVSVCGCTSSQTQTLLPESQWASVPRACTKILMLHPHALSWLHISSV